jgi:hypothetical protein
MMYHGTHTFITSLGVIDPLRQQVHLKGHFFGVWSNPVARGTGFLQFGLTIRHF